MGFDGSQLAPPHLGSGGGIGCGCAKCRGSIVGVGAGGGRFGLRGRGSIGGCGGGGGGVSNTFLRAGFCGGGAGTGLLAPLGHGGGLLLLPPGAYTPALSAQRKHFVRCIGWFQ